MAGDPILHFITFLGIILRLIIKSIVLTDLKQSTQRSRNPSKSNVEKKVNMLYSFKDMVLFTKYNLKTTFTFPWQMVNPMLTSTCQIKVIIPNI